MHSMSASRDSIDDGALRRVFLAEDSPAVSVIPISLFLLFFSLFAFCASHEFGDFHSLNTIFFLLLKCPPRSVPCEQRANQLHSGLQDEESAGIDDSDDWVATHVQHEGSIHSLISIHHFLFPHSISLHHCHRFR